MYSLKHLLEREPHSVVGPECLVGWEFTHLPELKNVLGDLDPAWFGGLAHRVDGLVMYHQSWDYRRYQSLTIVCLDQHPVMLVRNAGREGADHCSRFIIDEERHAKLLHLALRVGALAKAESMMKQAPEPETPPRGLDLNDDIESLFEFYHQDVRHPPY